MAQSWSAGILCYNEAGTIQQVVKDTVRVVADISGGDYEVIVVDDCSTDASRVLVEEMMPQYPNLRLVHHEENMGIGGALRSIYFHAEKENVIAICGDGQFDLEELRAQPFFLQNEFVSFYRLQNTQYNGFRNFLSFFNKWFNKYLLGIYLHDVNWVKAYKTSLIRALDLQLQSSLIESEICSKLLKAGARPLQFQSRYLPRTYGVSKGSSWRIVRKAIFDLVSLYVVVRRFNRKKGKNLKQQMREG